jgi:hypothetical protein
MADDSKSPLEDTVEQAIEQALDLFVYAPLGLALMARDNLPSIIERGRKQFGQQTMLARMMGQHAVREAEKRVRSRIDAFAEPPPPPQRRPATSPSAAAATTPATPAPPTTHDGNGKAAPAEAKPTADHLAIPGYDTLSASQVVQRLPGLSADELDAVRAYEEATRGRRTILTKIGQLQS